MAVGLQDPVLGAPVMARLRACISGCPAPFDLDDAGHFTQEAGALIVRRALPEFGM